MTKILLIILIVLLLAAFVAGYQIYRKIQKKTREVSMMLFHTADLAKGIAEREKEVQLTPKSVAGNTRIYLPNIMKDFPDFHYEEMKDRAQNVLLSYLQSIEENDASHLSEGTPELKKQLAMRLEMLESEGKREHFKNIKIHRTEITEYRREKGRKSVVFQSSIQYVHHIEQNGAVVLGHKENLEQSRYNVEVAYIQDREIVINAGEDAGLGTNCPNCGAPLKSVGAVKCEYCDTPITLFNIKVWSFDKVVELKKS